MMLDLMMHTKDKDTQDSTEGSTTAWVEIDGSMGEGGGQILRSSLALSIITGKPVRLHKIRARRRKPGLMRQHLAAVRAAAAISGAEVEGDEVRSTALSFTPGKTQHDVYNFAIGTAGSTTLVLQTILWPLLVAKGHSEVTIEGGTHNPMAPPFDFMARSLLPLLQAMGARVELRLERHGFYPAGGGRIVAEIEGGQPLGPLSLLSRGAVRTARGRAVVALLPVSIARRECKVLVKQLGWSWSDTDVKRVDSTSPGNVVYGELTHDGGCTVFTGVGEKGIPAEEVASDVAAQVEAFVAAQVPVDAHLADQLLIPMALGSGGSFRTVAPTMHTTTNAQIVERFLPVRVRIEPDNGDSESGAFRVYVDSHQSL